MQPQANLIPKTAIKNEIIVMHTVCKFMAKQNLPKI